MKLVTVKTVITHHLIASVVYQVMGLATTNACSVMTGTARCATMMSFIVMCAKTAMASAIAGA